MAKMLRADREATVTQKTLTTKVCTRVSLNAQHIELSSTRPCPGPSFSQAMVLTSVIKMSRGLLNYLPTLFFTD